jgi:hypothetical protein
MGFTYYTLQTFKVYVSFEMNQQKNTLQTKGSQSYLKYKFDNMFQFKNITKWLLRFKSWNLNFIYIIHFYLPHGKMELVSMIIAWRLQTLVNVVSIHKWSMDDHVLLMEYIFHLAKHLTSFWCHHLWLKGAFNMSKCNQTIISNSCWFYLKWVASWNEINNFASAYNACTKP